MVVVVGGKAGAGRAVTEAGIGLAGAGRGDAARGVRVGSSEPAIAVVDIEWGVASGVVERDEGVRGC